MRNLYNSHSRNIAHYQSASALMQPRLQGLPFIDVVEEAAAFVDRAQAKADKLERAVTWLSIAAGVNMGIGLILLLRRE